MELEWHPENYRTKFCSTVKARKRCSDASCGKAHNSCESRPALSDEYKDNCLSYQVRYMTTYNESVCISLLKNIQTQQQWEADLYVTDKSTSLHMAAKRGFFQYFQLLETAVYKQKFTVNYHVQSKFGLTPLMEVAGCMDTDPNDPTKLHPDKLEVLYFLFDHANNEEFFMKDNRGQDIFAIARKNVNLLKDNLRRELVKFIHELVLKKLNQKNLDRQMLIAQLENLSGISPATVSQENIPESSLNSGPVSSRDSENSQTTSYSQRMFPPPSNIAKSDNSAPQPGNTLSK